MNAVPGCISRLSDSFYSFESVSDRFLAELGPVAAGQVSKDDTRYENLVKGLRHIHIKVIGPTLLLRTFL